MTPTAIIHKQTMYSRKNLSFQSKGGRLCHLAANCATKNKKGEENSNKNQKLSEEDQKVLTLAVCRNVDRI
jgi:hypothetical protein